MSHTLKPVRVPDLVERAARGERLAMLTAYDATMARLLDRAGVDMILVGDSVGMVVMGYANTIPVTLEAMVHHTAAVARGVRRALVVADMPFLSYQTGVAEAVRNAGRLIQEGGAAAVKLEGGRAVAEVVARLVEAGIPVMGHVGLTPQSIHKIGGFRRMGKSPEEAEEILEDALALERAGAFAVVLESIPAEAARVITERLSIPTIGIGAGPHCNGQVLVSYDALGLCEELAPPFAKQYARLGEFITEAAKEYIEEVRSRRFPAPPGAGPLVLHTVSETRRACAAARRRYATTGFVPTMGALHEGHAELIRRARADCDWVLVSIFVNPIQFDRADDFRAYPRTLEEDVQRCRSLGVDAVFAPAAEEMYPGELLTSVEVARISENLCGKFRPGHFRGVATVVTKLLNIVQPDKAYFGEKDAQQLAVIRKLAADLNLPAEIVAVPTVREADGLALSSRNQRLTPADRAVAPKLYRALLTAKGVIEGGGGAAEARRAALDLLAAEPRVRVEYLEVVDAATMQPVEAVKSAVRVSAAVWLGEVRLIDNVLAVPGSGTKEQ